jgi:nitrite reductase/ring-hydroxylating ferredoxin subunit
VSAAVDPGTLRIPGGAQIADGGRLVVTAGNVSYLVIRAGDRWYACENRCRHLGVRLSGGLVDGTVIECRWHHWRHDLSTGEIEADQPAPGRVETFDVAVDGSDLVIRTDRRAVPHRRTPASDPSEKA